MTEPLAKREVLVAGAGEPIGRAVALAFSHVATRVVAIDDDLDALGALRVMAPDSLTTAALEVRDSAAVHRDFKFLTNWFTDVDVLINCAGAEGADAASYEMALHLSDLGGGDIITVARLPQERVAVRTLTAKMALRYAGYHIRCLGVAPSNPIFPSPESLAYLALQTLAPGQGIPRI